MDNKKAFKALNNKLKELQRSQKRLQPDNKQSANLIHAKDFNAADLHSAYTPYKSTACKKCPALTNGLCKCALKQMHKVA